ncbi:MAG: MFS transporter [Deltaproteobacteria bacterium]|jgi:EmrB/QacA subfamily drug resistance transporter|nr:MFS transporter [Deltaproteobacteria bacterium]
MVATLTSFMGPFTISSVNVALPAIQVEFSADAVLLSWVATSYLLAIAVFLVPFGKAADIYGRKKIFTRGIALYTVSSLLAVFSFSMNVLIFMRVIQGIGAAMFVTTGMAIITSIFPPSRRGRAIGIYVAAVYIGLSVGPFAGGFLTRYLGWRSIFAVVVPFGAASVFMTMRYLKGEWADARGETIDVRGSLLYGFSILILIYGASLLPQSAAVYLMVAGLVGLGLFIKIELKVSYPVFEVKLFNQNRLFTFSSLAALINYSATFALTFLLSLYLQYIKGIPPQYAGSILIAQPIMMAVFSPLAGRLSDRIEPRLIASVGMLITVIGLVFFAFIGPQTSKAMIVLVLALLGFGFALFSSPNMNAIMSSVEKRYLGIASGAVATMRLLGQMVSMAIAMVVFAIFIGREQIAPSNYSEFLKSVRVSFLIFSLLCTLGILFSMSRGEIRRKD